MPADARSDRPARNTAALVGFILGIASVLFAGFAPFGLLVSVVGLARVDPDAQPPIGGNNLAIAGVILSVAGVVLWVALVAIGVRSFVRGVG